MRKVRHAGFMGAEVVDRQHEPVLAQPPMLMLMLMLKRRSW